MAYSASMMMPECYQCYNEMYPLVLTGLGYSIYAAAIWGSIPYVVEPNTLGTAFGIATAIQNIGLVVSPTIVGQIKDTTGYKDHGYYYVNMFFVVINLIGLALNLSLYYIDINHNNSVLDRVEDDDSKEKEE